MEHDKPKKGTEWDFDVLKEYLLKNPDKIEYIKELRQISEKERVDRYVGLVKIISNGHPPSEFKGFSIFALGLRDVQLDELLSNLKT